MKRILILLTLTIITTDAFSQKLSKPKKVEITGTFANPIPSPTGEFILLTNEKSQGISLLNIKTKKITQISKTEGSGYGYSWSNDSETFFYKVKPENGYIMNSEVFNYNIKTKKTERININHNYLPSYKGNIKESNIVVYTNIMTLKIEAIDLNTSKAWVVTNEEGQFYNAILSHDGKKVAVHNGPNIFVYNIDGSGIISKLGIGIATSWSKNDKYLLGFMDESSDGHEISNSDLYLFDVVNSKSKKITQTKDSFESDPSFFGTNMIIYNDKKTGQIFTSQINF
ncbi:TolB family protein [Flavobacterium sp.]|uniref:TolB family protein n=1 Tax=Flavobacterium sp. TaxID=239 RepID=UPI003750DF1F